MEQVERFDTNQRLQFINTKEQVNTDVSMNLPRKPQNVLLVCSKINDRFFALHKSELQQQISTCF